MTYEIQESASGGFEIVQIMPVVVGSFPNRPMAEKIMQLLDADAVADASGGIIPRIEPLPIEPLPNDVAKPAVAPKPSAKPPQEEDWTKEELERAYLRLQRGDKLRNIADEIGKSWTKLRSRWATEKKRLDRLAPKNVPAVVADPVQMVKAVIDELNDQGDCNLCGKKFTISPDNIDTCLRCLEEV